MVRQKERQATWERETGCLFSDGLIHLLIGDQRAYTLIGENFQ